MVTSTPSLFPGYTNPLRNLGIYNHQTDCSLAYVRLGFVLACCSVFPGYTNPLHNLGIYNHYTDSYLAYVRLGFVSACCLGYQKEEIM